MHFFHDAKGRKWAIVINVLTIKKVRSLCDFDLASMLKINGDHLDASGLAKLGEDPVLLVDVLFSLCFDQEKGKSVTDEDFGAAMTGDALPDATQALLEEIVDFFPEARRKMLRKLLDYSSATCEKELKIAEKNIDQLIGSSVVTSSPESSE